MSVFKNPHKLILHRIYKATSLASMRFPGRGITNIIIDALLFKNPGMYNHGIIRGKYLKGSISNEQIADALEFYLARKD